MEPWADRSSQPDPTGNRPRVPKSKTRTASRRNLLRARRLRKPEPFEFPSREIGAGAAEWTFHSTVHDGHTTLQRNVCILREKAAKLPLKSTHRT